MTPPDAGRVEEIRQRHREQRDWLLFQFRPDLTLDGQVDAVSQCHKDRADLLDALTTQAETIRRLEGEVIKWKAANAVPILETQEGIEAIRAVFQELWAEKLRQRAEAAEGHLARVVAAYHQTRAAHCAGCTDHRHEPKPDVLATGEGA